MSRLMKQIQEIQEQFSNLFEVEGLGNPAMDVPPSQNKIKKDRKTKDGKVEVVSVEDELFPYEGNKREQYRQKIIDTINNMIQGTATLEDLLQLVRQKKAPLKEAMEILEAIKDDVKNHKKYTGGTSTFSYKGNDYSYTPEKGLKKEGQTKDSRNPIQKVVDSSNKEFDKARKYNYGLDRQSRNIGKKINKEVAKLEKTEGKGAFPEKTNDTIKKLVDTANTIKANKTDADKNFTEINKRQQDMADNAKGVKHQMYDIWTSKKKDAFGWKPTVKTSEALQEAMKLMEDLYSTIKQKHGEPKYEGSDSHPANKSAELMFKMDNAKMKERKEAVAREKKPEETDMQATYRVLGKRCTLDTARGKQDDIRKYKKSGHEGVNPSSLKEAIELMEEVINEVSVGALARATENNFNKRREVAKASTENAKRAYDNYEKQSKEHPEEEGALYKATSKLGNIAHKDREKASHANDLANLNLPKDSKVPANKLFNAADKTYTNRGKEVDKALEKGKGRGDKEFDSSMKKYARAVDLAVADPVVSRRTNEALELVENLYKEINKKFNKGELSVDQALKLEKKVQDKISPEKREKDGKELDAESKTSLEPEIQVNKNLKALRRNDKKRNEGKSNYKFSFDHVPTKEALEEILEDLYGVIQKQPKEKRAKLVDKYNTMKQKEGAGTYDLHQKMLKHKSKQEKGQEKTEERSEGALKKYLDAVKDHSESTPSMYQFEALKEAIRVLSRLTEENHHANKGNPVVKITDKNYGVASGKSLPGPFNKNHVGQYIVYNKDTDASYLVTPDNWKKSKIKKDLERQGKFYEALEETAKILELFDRPDLLDEIDTALGSPVKKTFKNISNLKKEKKAQEEVKK